jgi:predicted Zn-dependent peptidase
MTFPLPPDLPSLETLDGPRLLEYSVATTSNGLSVWCARRTAVPLASVRLVIRGGRALDPPEKPGLATLLASSLREGTQSRTGEELSALAQSAGGDLAVAAGDDSLVVAATGLASRLDLILDLVADVARNPAFLPGDVERVKSLALEELATDEADPSFLASREFRRSVYGSHPYAVGSPTAGSIADLRPEILRREASRRILPSRTLLLVVGDVDPAAAAATAGRFFGEWRDAASAPPEPEPALASPAPFCSSVLLDRPGSVQTNLHVGGLGLARRDPDAFPLHLATTIFGGAFSSRLVTNLREEKGYTYSPATSARWLRGGGLVRTTAAVRNEVTGAALNEILYERSRMATTDATDEELERCRSRELGGQVLALQTNAGLAGELADLWLNDLGPEELPRADEALRSVTKADVRRASRRFFGLRGLHVVAVGDAKAVRRELETFGIVEMVSAGV